MPRVETIEELIAAARSGKRTICLSSEHKRIRPLQKQVQTDCTDSVPVGPRLEFPGGGHIIFIGQAPVTELFGRVVDAYFLDGNVSSYSRHLIDSQAREETAK